MIRNVDIFGGHFSAYHSTVESTNISPRRKQKEEAATKTGTNIRREKKL